MVVCVGWRVGAWEKDFSNFFEEKSVIYPRVRAKFHVPK